jgi:hypothetical protein
MNRLIYLILSVILILANPLFSETINGTITGKITSAATGEPLPGASIMVDGTPRGTSSNIDGNYKITNVPVGIHIIKAQLLGYLPATRTDVVVNSIHPTEINISLYESPIQTQGLIVIPDYFDRTTDSKISTQVQSNEEIRRLPGAFEDVVRAISILPGVAQALPGRNDLIVRGGAPSENLYLVDNIVLANFNHFGTQGASGGPLSFVNLDYVDATSFSTGGFGARYGNRISSVLDIDLRNGRSDKFGGKATVSATQFGLNGEGPFADNGTYLLSVRRSYLDLIFKAAGFAFVPEYWDFLGKANYTAGRNNRFSFLTIGAIDNVRLFNDTPDKRFDNSKILASNQNQYVAGVTWKHLFGWGYSDVALSQNTSEFKYKQADSLLQPVFSNNSVENETRLNGTLNFNPSKNTELSFGGEIVHVNVDADLFLRPYVTSYGDSLSLDNYFKSEATRGGGFVQVARNFGSLKTTIGLRYDYFDLIKYRHVYSPRLSTTYIVTDKFNINLSLGQYRQTPSYIWLVANSENRKLKFVTANQIVAGLEYIFRTDTKLTLEAYFKKYYDYPASLSRPYLVLANTGAGYGGAQEGFAAFGIDPLTSGGKGRAKGLELFIQKKLSQIPCYGTFSLGYNESKFAGIDGQMRPGSYDQRWIFNVGGGYIFNERWEVSGKFRYASGRPYTPYNPDGTQSADLYNSIRLRANHSLDIRVERRFNRVGWGIISYIDIQNIYNRKAVDIPSYNERTGETENSSSIGILPSIGFSLEW